jgi:hypothetical protein
MNGDLSFIARHFAFILPYSALVTSRSARLQLESGAFVQYSPAPLVFNFTDGADHPHGAFQFSPA